MATFFQAMQRPSVDGLNTYLICRAVHEAGFKVALSGLGGDEAVGGYSHFRQLKYLPALRAMDAVPLPAGAAAARLAGVLGATRGAKARRLLGKHGPRDGMGLVLLTRELFPAPLVNDLTGVRGDGMAERTEALGWKAGCPADSFAAMAAAEVAIYLQATLLPDADTFSMASSVELRVPFVDSHVFCRRDRMRSDPQGRAGKGSDRRGAGRSVSPSSRECGPSTVSAFPWGRGWRARWHRCWRQPASPTLPYGRWWTGPRLRGQACCRCGRVGRWAEPWALTVLNSWLAAWGGDPA